MKAVWSKLHKAGDILHLPDIPNWLLAVLSSMFLLRVPSFFEPYFYGDEMVYMTLGQGVRQGLTLYKDIYDNKPPLLYLTAAAAGNLFWFKVILAFWSLVTIYLFYKLSKIILTKNDKGQKISTIIFALLTTLPLLEGLTVNAELFMIVFTIGALLIVLSDKINSKKIYLAGLLLGLGTLFKIPAAFDAPVIVFYWIITDGFKNWKAILKNTVLLILGFVTPLFVTFVWYFLKGALPEYIKAAFLQNVGYLSSFRPGDVQKPFLERNAPLLMRGAIVLAGSFILYLTRKKLSKKFILLTLWILFALFAVTLSERPYPHYLIQAVAPVSLLASILFTENNLEQSLVIIPLTLSLLVPVYYKFWTYPVISYYNRFVSFAIGKESKSQYFNGFSPTVERDYKIAEFLVNSSSPGENVFMWDPDSAAIYSLSGRLPPIKYVVDYHIYDYSSMEKEAKEIIDHPPKFIILTDSHPYHELSVLLQSSYIPVEKIDGASIYSRIDFASAK